VTPVELLNSQVTVRLVDAAYILGLVHPRKGGPDRRQVLALVKAGRLRVVDPSQPVTRLTIATDEIRRYLTLHGEQVA
jgi:hypothetical protein